MASSPVDDLNVWREIVDRVRQKNPLISMMLEFETFTGLRNSDSGMLKFSDVMINGTVRKSFNVVQSKSYNMRINRKKNPSTKKAAKAAATVTITVNQQLKDLILDIHAINGQHKLMFQSGHHSAKSGRPITRQYINRVLGDIAKDMQLDFELSTHSMRKTFARTLLKTGANIKDISTLLGHGSVATTDIYLNSMDNSAAQAVEALSFPVSYSREGDDEE